MNLEEIMNRPASWTRYCKSYNLGHRQLKHYFDTEVTIEEKIDGSQFSFCKTYHGELLVRSRGREFDIHGPDGMFEKACEAVEKQAPYLQPGFTYRGEYLNKRKHNVLCYDRVPTNNIIIYDIAIGDCNYIPHTEAKQHAEAAGFEFVPVLGTMTGLDWNIIEKLMETESVLGGEKIEGVVFKRRNFLRFNDRDQMIIAKYVSPDFKERHRKTPQDAHSGKDIVTRIIHEFRTEARWQKAYQHLLEAGELTHEPRDIGKLIKEIQRDVMEDASEEIKERIWKHIKKTIERGLVHGAPEWYKAKLAAMQE